MTIKNTRGNYLPSGGDHPAASDYRQTRSGLWLIVIRLKGKRRIAYYEA